MLTDYLKTKNPKKQQKERANKIGIPFSLLKEIENTRKIKQSININIFANLCSLLASEEIDSVFANQLLERLSFVSKYGACSLNSDGIKATVDLGNNVKYNFLFTASENKLATHIFVSNKEIESTFIKDKYCSYTINTVKIVEKTEKMLEGFINKNYDSYLVKIEKDLHCFNHRNKEFAFYLEDRMEDYALNRNTNEKIINTQRNNFNCRNKQYFFKVGNQIVCKLKNNKQEETYYSSNSVFRKDNHIVLPRLFFAKEISDFEYNQYLGKLKTNEKYKKLIKEISK